MKFLGYDFCRATGCCGLNGPAFIVHVFVLLAGLTGYLHFTGDNTKPGCVFTPALAMYQDLLGKHIPNQIYGRSLHFWICLTFLLDALAHLFPSFYTKFVSKKLGLKVADVQVASAVALPCWGIFYLAPFDGFPFFCFAFGYGLHLLMNMPKTKKNLKLVLILLSVTLTKFCGILAASHGTVTNFHHAFFVLWAFVGFLARSSTYLASDQEKVSSRGRSRSRVLTRGRSRSKSAAKKNK